MQTAIIGVAHKDTYVKETLRKVLAQRKSNKPFVVAIEESATFVDTVVFWSALKHMLQRSDGVKVAFLGSPRAENISSEAFDTLKYSAWLKAFNEHLSVEEIEHMNKGLYVMTKLRDKYFIKKIRNLQPDVAVLGPGHAYSVGKALRTPVTYVGCTESKVKQTVMDNWMRTREIIAQRKKLFKQRKNKAKRNIRKPRI